jgi:glycosyltransferase involved in cell wall biosynthesis
MRRSVALVGLLAAGSSGVSRYAIALTRALGEVAPEYPALDLRLLTTAAGAERLGPMQLDVRATPLRNGLIRGGPGRILLEQLRAATSRSDLLHFFDVSGPVLAPRKPFVATIHDAGVMHGFGTAREAYKRRLYPWALSRARATVAVSGFARDEAVRHFDGDAGKIAVVHSGPGFAPTAGTTNHEATRDFGLTGGGYHLYVGNLNANKNLPFLVRAFDRAGLSRPLVLVGRRGEGFGELEAAVQRASAPVTMIFDAADAEIDRLYREATALLLPSSYEGFGFTPLEAMSRGCPVLASDIPALREVAGAGALLLPLDDEEAWAAAIRSIDSDRELQQSLRQRGADCVSRYSWADTARRVCELFTRIEL